MSTCNEPSANLREADRARGFVLLESTERWVLAPRTDPRLKVGCYFEYLGTVWMVTWGSDEGFGSHLAN